MTQCRRTSGTGKSWLRSERHWHTRRSPGAPSPASIRIRSRPRATPSAASLFAAHVALAEGKWDEALALLREADTRKTVEDRYALVQMGRAHEAAGRPDSAMGTTKVPGHAGSVPRPACVLLAGPSVARRYLRRVRARAGRPWSRSKFVELWADADPELQPQVKEIRGRLERLRAAVG